MVEPAVELWVDDHQEYEPGVAYASGTPTSTAAELTRLNELRTEGAISDAEFADLKARTIAAS